MKDDNTEQIEEILIKNLARIFTEYGWTTGEGVPESFQAKVTTIRSGLYLGDAFGFKTHLSLIIEARKKDHKWGIFTPAFLEGTLTLLKAYAKKHYLFDIRGKAWVTPTKEPSKENLFEELDHAKAAIKRLYQFGKTNIRYSLIEEYGEDRVRKDLRKVVPYAKLDILTEDHEPDQIRDWLYDGGVTKMTVMYPFMPLVIISIDD